MVYTKKAISPVVATALLLVVAVVAVVGFQNWFTSYQSDINTKVETESQTSSTITVERLEVDGTIYIKNSGAQDVETLNAKIKLASSGAQVANCILGDTLLNATANTVTQDTIDNDSTCSLNIGTTYNVVITTDKGVLSMNTIAR